MIVAKNDVLPEERIPLLKKLLKEERATLGSLDTETSLARALVWGTGEQYVSEKQIEEPTRLIMAQYVVEGTNTPKLITWDQHQNDRGVIEALHKELFNKPNLIIVGQNQKRFDIKIINDRAVFHGLPPIPFKKITQVDILQMSRSSFRRHSHGLDYRSKMYGFGGKLPMQWEDWRDVYYNVPGALDKMARYGLKDPVDTLAVFWKELPYYTTLPAQLERLLREAKGNSLLMCKDCEKKKLRKYDVDKVNKKGIKSDNGTYAKCNRCDKVWKLEYE